MKACIFFILCGFLLSGSYLFADCGFCDSGSNKFESSKKQGKHYRLSKEYKDTLIKKLNLSADQSTQFDALSVQYKEDVHELQHHYIQAVENLLTKKQYRTFVKNETKFLYVHLPE